MPELPEVETTRKGITPKVLNQTVQKVIIRQHQLRWEIPTSLPETLAGLVINKISRRAKYLLLKTNKGHLIIHLGMSGNLKILPRDTPPQKHDHVDIEFDNGWLLRYHDPRRFGAMLWTEEPIKTFKLLRHLGPEPLTDEFSADYFHRQCLKRKVSIKVLLMDNKCVVGVGNIYANESLSKSQILPTRIANSLSLQEAENLVKNIKVILEKAIEQGGTTLKDFSAPDGKPGYFVQQLAVYGRAGQDCGACGTPIQKIIQAQRASYYCSTCQN